MLVDLPGPGRRCAELMPAAQTAVAVATRVVLTLVVVTLMLAEAALRW